MASEDFCKNTFCPAANAAWPLELNQLCRPLVAKDTQAFGSVINNNISASILDFCLANKQSILAELQPGNAGGFSAVYEKMLGDCKDICVQRHWACLVPQSYCSRVGNSPSDISDTFKYLGDSGGLLDTTQIQRYTDESSCNAACLKSESSALPVI
jgi:hypothetical protein